MKTPVTDFQRAILESFRDGRHAALADAESHEKLVQALRKDPEAALLAVLIDAVKGMEDAAEAGAQLMSAETDVRAAMAAVGAVATRRHGMGR